MSTKKTLPLWRSLLFVPVNVERFVEKAHLRGADGIQLDLEDSVPESEKDAARRVVPAVAERVARGGADVVVRINRPLSMAVRDMEASICERVTALALPKVQSAEHVQLLAEHASEIEAKSGLPEGHTRFIVMVETGDAFFRMAEIAKADPRIVAMTLGGEDFATSVGMAPEPEGLLMPKQAMIFAATAASLLPMGFVGSIAGFADIEGFRAIVRRSRTLGFRGASCIHPNQVAVLNEEFRPPAQELAHARKIIDAYDLAKAEGRGSVSVDGRMIDVPIVQRAEALIAWEEAIRAREARTEAARG
ncbi:HpcH/HpaI aldolase/citrate lyase family protein [Marinimicrococcus flavescens]|uniref:CoA ester lyase n=1 Tax=Marinimicrococcus flavescens TaxID=3031815 RepID=A0AAP3XQT8_9PROT|nr:CoA ester lyase [Marinimicrococcus flavescens]